MNAECTNVGLSDTEIRRAIADLGDEQPWNHNIEMGDGINTSPSKQLSHGKNLVKWERISPILDKVGMAGKRVLDIGCNEGFFTLKISERGAHVIGGDVDELRIKKARFVQSVLQRSDVEFHVLDIYSRKFQELDPFDICVCMGFLHRIPDPFRAVASIANKTDMILFEWKALKHGPHDEPFAYFSQKGIDQKDFYGTEYWLLSYAALESVLRRVGFNYFYRVDDPRQRRAILLAGKYNHPIFSEPDIVLHRGRLPALLSHSKRYLKAIAQILTGRLNS